MATRPTIMNKVREGVWIESLRRETEGIKKWNQVFDNPVLASKCMDSYFDDKNLELLVCLLLLQMALIYISVNFVDEVNM